MKTLSTEDEQSCWADVQQQATEMWLSGDLAGAIRVVSLYLEGVPALDLQREAIAFRADLYEEHGDIQSAKEDYRFAHRLIDDPDYVRYTIELSLGALSEKTSDLKAADQWYRAALSTAAQDPGTSGGVALRRLLELRQGQGLDDEEITLTKKVIRQAWHLLRIEGKPDLQNLGEAARRIIEAQGRSFSLENPPSPKEF